MHSYHYLGSGPMCGAQISYLISSPNYLILCAALLLMPTAWQSPILWFGRIVTGQAGSALLAAAAARLTASAWAILKRRRWGWWCALGIITLATISIAYTTTALTIGELIASLPLTPVEASWFTHLPFFDVHPIGIVIVPIVVLTFVLAAARSAN
jgi:hypothetical protein